MNKDKLKQAALIVVRDACALKHGERVLIITNPQTDVAEISRYLYAAIEELGGEPVIITQKEKASLDFADKSMIAALKTEPPLCLSISSNKMGKDEDAIKFPFTAKDGETYDHIFNYNMEGKKNMRAIWTPGITLDMFERTVCIDYALLQKRCNLLSNKFREADYVHVTAPSGTDILVPVVGRKGLLDDGNFSKVGSGGNIPAGEVFISPTVGGKTGKSGDVFNGCQGRIVFDGSMSVNEGDFIINDPIVVDVVDGFVTNIASKAGRTIDGTIPECEAYRLLKTITDAEKSADDMVKVGTLSAELGTEYTKNARNIGELGIGLNPAALITGNMLEDEKAFKTCHFAIGSNYDNDANSLIHLDGVVLNPTITIHYTDGTSFVVEKDGELVAELVGE